LSKGCDIESGPQKGDEEENSAAQGTRKSWLGLRAEQKIKERTKTAGKRESYMKGGKLKSTNKLSRNKSGELWGAKLAKSKAKREKIVKPCLTEGLLRKEGGGGVSSNTIGKTGNAQAVLKT